MEMNLRTYKPGKHGLNLARGCEGPMTTREFKMSDDIYDIPSLFADRVALSMLGLEEDDIYFMASRDPLSIFQIKEEDK